jgi:hypothetical protein
MEVRRLNADSFLTTFLTRMFVSPKAGADLDSILSMDLDPRKPKWAEKINKELDVFSRSYKNISLFFRKKCKFCDLKFFWF